MTEREVSLWDHRSTLLNSENWLGFDVIFGLGLSLETLDTSSASVSSLATCGLFYNSWRAESKLAVGSSFF